MAGAKERALELTSARDASEQKICEDQVARCRAEQHVQRIELFRQQKLDILEQDDISDGDIEFDLGAERHLEAEVAREACQTLLDQLLSMRRKIVKAMQTELIRREQLTTFETQYYKLESDVRGAERLQRAYAENSTAAGVLGQISLQELKDLDASVARQQVQFGTYQSVLNERREMWHLTVSHVQRLKIAIRKKKAEIRTTLHQVRESIAVIRKGAGQLRGSNERMVTLKASIELDMEKKTARTRFLKDEQSLLQAHGGPFFDTDVWQPGVTQRMSTITLNEGVEV